MRRDPRPRVAGWLAGVVLAAALLAPSAPAFAAADAREVTAREYFASGRYREALDLFAKLYAESLHPNYLRNIGRCYQNLGQPDRAIVSFHDYLRKAKVTPEERAEIEGFIKEMEDLKRQQQEAAASPAPVTPLPAAAAPPPPPASDPAPPATAAAVVTTTSAAPADEAPPVYTRWWFWTIVGAGAVAIALGGATAGGVFTTIEDASCPAGRRCP